MKTLLSALSILVLAVSCNKEPAAELQEKQQEVNKDLLKQQKEEEVEYVEDTEAADPSSDTIKIIKKEKPED